MPVRRTILVASTLGALAAGSAFGAAVLTPAVGGAASSSTTTAATGTTSSPPSGAPGGPAHNFDPTKGGHTANGITEELLTGDTATKASAAALAAVPDGTIQRVENDAEGSAYEAHMTKADGTEVTVKLDANFTVTSIETGR